MKRLLFVLYTLLVSVGVAVAQEFTLQGKVVDEQMAPMEFATVA